jgi:hypothetical protein
MGEWVLLPVVGTIGAAVIGLLGAIVVALVKLRGGRDYYDKKATKFLVSRLPAGGFTFAQADTLGEKIGLTKKEISQLLFLKGFVPAENEARWESVEK